MAIFSAIKYVIILVIILVIVGGLWYVINLKANLATSEANNKLLQNSIKSQQELILSIQLDVADIQRINSELKELSEKQKEEVKNLNSRFNTAANGEQRDFGALAAARPDAIQRAVNRGTVNVMRCFELITGAVHTEKELNAKTSSEINRECPSIANPNYKPAISN